MEGRQTEERDDMLGRSLHTIEAGEQRTGRTITPMGAMTHSPIGMSQIVRKSRSNRPFPDAI
jgi:hypothetical protein